MRAYIFDPRLRFLNKLDNREIFWYNILKGVKIWNQQKKKNMLWTSV